MGWKLYTVFVLVCGLIGYRLPAQTLCEPVFAGQLKKAYGPKEKKFRKKTIKICSRQLGKQVQVYPERIVLIPRLYYKKSVREHKRVGSEAYFCHVDPHSVQYDAALILTPEHLYVLFASPVKKHTYRVLPDDKTLPTRHLAEMVVAWQPDFLFTVNGDREHVFFIKNDRIGIFARSQGRMVETDETLRRIIDDPLIFRYVAPGS